ncbi:hypothetical protein [Bacillus siamensis]|uniref:hypothetical protein n=1 Tax=Bacillus siamensis TaxID=659243 RepID=UPI0022B7CB44|nr:hypothetical protein [Bacillus siamensis]
MVIGDGKSVFHEESTLEGPVEMLQIFKPPEKADLELEFSFHMTKGKLDSGI